jgi:hypothetical protein
MSKATKITLVFSTLLSCSSIVVFNLSILEKYPISRDKIATMLIGTSGICNLYLFITR